MSVGANIPGSFVSGILEKCALMPSFSFMLDCEMSSFAGPQCDRRGIRCPLTSLLLQTAAWLESQMAQAKAPEPDSPYA